MIAALDSLGSVFFSLLQSNTNTKTFGLFMRHLVSHLDRSRKEWRKKTVILLDNAPYHIGKSVLNLMQQLQIPVLFTGPHSYDAAPIELLFAAFKAADINPRKIKTGKQ